MKTTIQNIAGYMLGGVMFVVLVPEEEEELMPMQSSRGTRFKMSLNVGVQPNLLFGLVLNERTGDEIKARGDGAITIGYDDQTDIISMVGTYTVQSGTMGFTVGNMIRRIIWRPRNTLGTNEMYSLVSSTITGQINNWIGKLTDVFSPQTREGAPRGKGRRYAPTSGMEAISFRKLDRQMF